MKDKFEISVGNIVVPVQFAVSKGRNIRFSYKNGSARISVPRLVDQEIRERATKQMKVWLENLALKKPHLFQERQPSLFYRNELILMGDTYKIEVVPNRINNNIYGNLNEYNLHFEVPQSVLNNSHELRVQLPLMMNRLFRQRVALRVFEVNNRTIRGPISKVSLRSADSRWGSCSHANAIMLSNRLLLAPLPILDAVIIHELAHVTHKNHSHSFWKLVAQHDSKWREHHSWLDENGHSLQY